MSDRSPPVDIGTSRATLRLPDLRDTLRQAIVQYGSDPQLRRALIHAEKAVSDRANRGPHVTKDR